MSCRRWEILSAVIRFSRSLPPAVISPLVFAKLFSRDVNWFVGVRTLCPTASLLRDKRQRCRAGTTSFILRDFLLVIAAGAPSFLAFPFPPGTRVCTSPLLEKSLDVLLPVIKFPQTYEVAYYSTFPLMFGRPAFRSYFDFLEFSRKDRNSYVSFVTRFLFVVIVRTYNANKIKYDVITRTFLAILFIKTKCLTNEERYNSQLIRCVKDSYWDNVIFKNTRFSINIL